MAKHAMGITDRIAGQIYARRQRAKMTQKQLAEALEVVVLTVSRWERGTRTPPFEIIEDLGRVFNCDVSEFFKVPKSDKMAKNTK